MRSVAFTGLKSEKNTYQKRQIITNTTQIANVLFVRVILTYQLKLLTAYMLSALYANAGPSVCPSVCHTGDSQKRLHLGLCDFHHKLTVAPSL